MKNRIIYGVLFALLLLIMLTANSTMLVAICVGVTAVTAIWEMWTIVGRKNVWAFLIFSFIIVGGFACIPLIRLQEFGEYTIYFPFACAFLTDTFAYFFGMWLGQKGGHKLAPKVSPKKSWEGAIGGVVGTTIAMTVWGWFLYRAKDGMFWQPSIPGVFIGIIKVNVLNLVILGFLASIIAQLGDLAASWIKRRYGVKDYGNVIPGHGGIMDRCDSLIFVAPFIYIFMKYFPIII